MVVQLCTWHRTFHILLLLLFIWNKYLKCSHTSATSLRTPDTRIARRSVAILFCAVVCCSQWRVFNSAYELLSTSASTCATPKRPATTDKTNECDAIKISYAYYDWRCGVFVLSLPLHIKLLLSGICATIKMSQFRGSHSRYFRSVYVIRESDRRTAGVIVSHHFHGTSIFD